jgi:flagellar motility protein MotE (MotC chaperone)
MLKISLSGLYLRSGSLPFADTTSAVASEKTNAPTVPGTLSEDLRKWEKDLKSKEEFLKKKEAELLPLEEEIESKMAELSELQERLTALAKSMAEREKALQDSKMDHLVALYSAMEPTKAAAIMDKLKMETVILILRHMKGKSAGQILGMMAPEKGASISEELSRMD